MSTEKRAVTLRDSLRQYKIEFRGPVDERLWPENYSAMFREVCQIGRRRYSERKDSRQLTNKQRARVKELLRSTWAQRRHPAGEATWRENTEHIVFESLMNNAKCSSCMNYRRQPEKLVWPSDGNALAALKFYSDRTIDCHCSTDSRSVEDLNFQGELNTFQNTANEVVHPDPSEAAEIRALIGDKKPDKVFGLNKTPTFDHYVSISDLPRHTPFAKSGLLYPFLVVEAKGPDGSNATFHSIETQSAFPIRTCLQLQQQLHNSSASSLRPLVWFIPYQGDIYGVSACVIEREQYLVFDLWMGRSTSSDGALQLLDIIDLISTWARDVYKPEVLSCLAGGRAAIRRLTPTVTESNTQMTEATSRPTLSVSEAPSDTEHDNNDLQREGSVIDLTMDADPMSHYLTGSIHTDRDGLARLASHPFLKWVSSDQPDFPLSQHMTIRHTNMVSLHFAHFTLPKSENQLRARLKKMKDMENDTVESIARHVLTAFMDHEGSLTLTSNSLAELRCHWLKDEPDRAEGPDTVLRAIIGFRANIRKTDWQIVRELWCVSCSIETIRSLASIIGMSTDVVVDSAINRFPVDKPSSPTFDFVRRLAGHKALSAALHSTNLYLTISRVETELTEYDWISTTTSVSQSTRSLIDIAQNTLATGNGFDLIDEGHELVEVKGRTLPPRITGLFPARPAVKHGAVMLRKGADWDRSVATWCLMILDATDFEDGKALAAVLSGVLSRDEVLLLVGGGYSHVTVRSNVSEESFKSLRRFFSVCYRHLMNV